MTVSHQVTSPPTVAAPAVLIRFLTVPWVPDIPGAGGGVVTSPGVWTVSGHVSSVTTGPAGRVSQPPAVETALQEIKARLAAPETASVRTPGLPVASLTTHVTPHSSGWLRTVNGDVTLLVTVVTFLPSPVATSPSQPSQTVHISSVNTPELSVCGQPGQDLLEVQLQICLVNLTVELPHVLSPVPGQLTAVRRLPIGLQSNKFFQRFGFSLSA